MAKVPRASQTFTVLTLVLSMALLVLVVLSMTGVVSLCGSKRRSRPVSARSRLLGTAAGACSGMAAPIPAAAQHGPAAPAAHSAPAAPAAHSAPAAPAAHSAPAAPVAAGGAVQLLDMEAPQAVEAVRASGRDKVVYVLGQMSCPACQACKKYLAQHGHGDVAVFVDLASHGGMLKDGSLPRGVAQSLGRGVPCLVAYSHRAGAVLKKVEGFSPKAVEEMVAMCKSA
jgi:Tfp pilus assembly protein PilX